MVFTIVFYICIALLGILLLFGVSRRPKGEITFFDRVSTKKFQGFLAVFIILHQTEIFLQQNQVDIRELRFFYYYGTLAVAFFFFCSGFGLIKRWMTDGDYIKGFMRRRIFTVLVPFFICNYIYLTDALLHNIRIGSHFGFGAVICSFFGIFMVNNQMWFAVEIMILYAAFRIVFARVKKPLPGILIMTAVCIAIVVTGLLSGHSDSNIMSYWFKGEWWYNTILMFPAGMLYAYKEESVNRKIKKFFFSVLIAASVLFIIMDRIHRHLLDISIYWTELDNSPHHILDKLTGLGTDTAFELIFLVLIVTVMSRVRFSNPVLGFFGKISLEAIMLNYLMIDKLYFLYVRFGIGVYLFAVIAGTIAVSSAVYLLKNLVLEKRSGLFDGKVT